MNLLKTKKNKINETKNHNLFLKKNKQNEHNVKSYLNFFKKRFSVFLNIYFQTEKKIVQNFKKDKNYKILIYKMSKSILYRIFKYFSNLLKNFYGLYFFYLFIFLLNNKKSFFSFIKSDDDIVDETKDHLNNIHYLYDAKNNKERLKISIFFRFSLIVLYKLFFKREFYFGEVFHSGGFHFSTSVLLELKKINLKKYILSAVKFFFCVFILNTISSIASLVINWYLMTTKFFSFFKNIIHSCDLLPLISLSSTGLFINQIIMDKITSSIGIKKIHLKESEIFLYINLMIFFLITHSKSDSEFLSIEKDKPYLRISLVNGVKKINILKINKNNLLIHKIKNFNLSIKLRNVFFIILPSRFPSVKFCSYFRNKLSGHQCSSGVQMFNPFFDAFRVALIVFILQNIEDIFSFNISVIFSIFNEKVLPVDNKEKKENKKEIYSDMISISIIIIILMINLLSILISYFSFLLNYFGIKINRIQV